MVLVLSFLSNLHQTERECQRISDAASPTPISDPAKISELKSVKIWIKVLIRTRKRRQMQALMRRMFEGSAQAER